jgi:hypothetical protein
MATNPAAYRVVFVDWDGSETACDLVRSDLVELALEQRNATRMLDIDGNPVGEYRAVPADAGKGWGV